MADAPCGRRLLLSPRLRGGSRTCHLHDDPVFGVQTRCPFVALPTPTVSTLPDLCRSFLSPTRLPPSTHVPPPPTLSPFIPTPSTSPLDCAVSPAIDVSNPSSPDVSVPPASPPPTRNPPTMGNLAMKLMSHPTVKSHVDEVEGPSARLSRRSNTKRNRGGQSVRDHCRAACDDFMLPPDAPPPRKAPPVVAEEHATAATFDSVHGSMRLKGLLVNGVIDGGAGGSGVAGGSGSCSGVVTAAPPVPDVSGGGVSGDRGGGDGCVRGPGSSVSSSSRSSMAEDEPDPAASSPALLSALRKASTCGGRTAAPPATASRGPPSASMPALFDGDVGVRSVRFLGVAGIIGDQPVSAGGSSRVEPIRLRPKPMLQRPIAHVMSM